MESSKQSFLEASVIDAEPDERVRSRALEVYKRISSLPIIDPHTHYPSQQIASNERWQDPTMLFLGVPGMGFDHYMARLMLSEGIDPELVYGRNCLSGPAPDTETNHKRFLAMVAALEAAPLNPSTLWFRAALEEVFGINTEIQSAAAESLWDQLTQKLAQESFLPQSVLESARVSVALTTDDPTDSLSEHQLHNSRAKIPRMLPTWRADPVLYLESKGRYDFEAWLDRLTPVSGFAISNLTSLKQALRSRMDFFTEAGCIASDLGISNFCNEACSKEQAEQILLKRLEKQELSQLEVKQWQTYMIRFLSLENARRGWVQFFHQGPLRDSNLETFKLHGPDIGGDVPGELIDRKAFVAFLDYLHSQKVPSSIDGTGLAKTVFFPINSSDYEFVLDTIPAFSGNSEAVPSKLQLGPPWWFNDTVARNAEVIGMICDRGSIGNWIGMLSDARSLPPVIARIKQFRAVLAVELSKRTLHESTAFTIELASKVAYQNVVDFLGVDV